MTTRAHVEHDPYLRGIRLAVARDRSYLSWGPLSVQPIEDGKGPSEDAWLMLEEGDARAIYEALAEYFGHTGHDIRALRKDYDAERKRVDRFIEHLVGR